MRVDPPQRLRWGIVGIGNIARRRVVPAILAEPGSELAAVVSRDADRAQGFGAAVGAPGAYTRLEDMLADPNVDVIAVTTPNQLHAEQVVAAARAGKHVFCDKPLATELDDARRAVEACRAAGVKLGMNFEFRQLGCFQDARALIARGEIGDVRIVQVDSSPGEVPLTGWRANPRLAGLGVVANVGVHVYDMLRFVLQSEVEEVVALLDVGASAGEAMEAVALTLLRFASGTLAYVSASQRTPGPLNDMVIHGSRGRIDGRGIANPRYLMERSGEGEMRIVADGAEQTRRYQFTGAFDRTVAEFARAVREDRAPAPSGTDGLRSVELMSAIAASARGGRVIQIEPPE